MAHVFSARNNAFFPALMLGDYIASGWILTDAIHVSNEVFIEFSGMPPEGKIRGVNYEGMPVWIDIPAPTKDQLIEVAKGKKQDILAKAQQKISLWQTQLQLGMISDGDKAKLINWMNYINALQAVDTSTAPDIDWPEQPEE